MTITWFDYRDYQRLQREVEAGFYPLLMALMARADTKNLARLKAAFPEVYAEFMQRYDAPGGVLPDDPPSIRERVFGGEDRE